MFSFQHLAPRHRKSCGLNISYQLDLRINVSYQVNVRVNAQFSRIILAVRKYEGESWQLQHFCERIRLHTLCWCLFRENACKAWLWAGGDQIKTIFFSKIGLSNVWKMSFFQWKISTIFGESVSQAVGVFVVKRKMTESREWRLCRALFISMAAPGIVLQKDGRATAARCKYYEWKVIL